MVWVQRCHSSILARRAAKTTPLRKFGSLHFNDLLMSSTSSYNINFVGMALPGDELTAKLWRIDDMLAGKIVVSVETSNSCGEKVLQGAAEVVQPATVYVYTSLGSQEPGMGMRCLGRRGCPSTCSLWPYCRDYQGQPNGEDDSFQRNSRLSRSPTLHSHGVRHRWQGRASTLS
jgi:hypothetical protein